MTYPGQRSEVRVEERGGVDGDPVLREVDRRRTRGKRTDCRKVPFNDTKEECRV